MSAKNNITRLLPYGGVGIIAKKLGISPGTASTAIRRGHPGHKAVQEAMRMIQESGVIATANALATLPSA